MQKIVPDSWTRVLNASHLTALDQESTVFILNTTEHVILLTSTKFYKDMTCFQSRYKQNSLLY